MHRSRRAFLTAVSTAVATGLAGCTDDSPADAETPSEATASPSASPKSPTAAGETATPQSPDLDLREANVVAVSLERRDAGVRFSVTLHHDDAGEPGYANWWQVVDLDGTRFGRRDLLHAHEQQPFTRSATIELPADVRCVVVRGHDETHGYGGRAMVVNLETGRTRSVDQGSDPQSIDETACPS
jgi:hypothetical protein